MCMEDWLCRSEAYATRKLSVLGRVVPMQSFNSGTTFHHINMDIVSPFDKGSAS